MKNGFNRNKFFNETKLTVALYHNINSQNILKPLTLKVLFQNDTTNTREKKNYKTERRNFCYGIKNVSKPNFISQKSHKENKKQKSIIKKRKNKNELKTVRLTHDSQCISSLLSSGPQFLIPSHLSRSDMQ